MVWVLCVALMTGFYFFIRFMVAGVNPDFGTGFFAGVVFMFALVWLTWKVTPESFFPTAPTERYNLAVRLLASIDSREH